MAGARRAHLRQRRPPPSDLALTGSSASSDDGRLALALCLPRLRDGGPDRVFLRLLAAFDRSAVAPTLFVATGTASVGSGVDVVLGGGRSKRLPVVATVRAVRRLRPQVALCTLDMIATVVIARPFLPRGTKVIVRPANHVVANAPAVIRRSLVRHRLALALDRACLRRADAVVAQSTPLAEALRGLGVRRPVRVIPNPIDGAELDRLASQAAKLPARGAVTMVAAGRLTEQKGFDVLVDAVAALPSTDGLRVWILGAGEAQASLVDRIRRAGLDPVIELVGEVANPFPYFAAADLFVLPSRWEGLSNALLEAQALGVPAVAAGGDAAGQEIVVEGITGWVVERPGADALAAALGSAVEQLPALDRAGIGELTRRRFDARVVASRYAAFASEVGAGGPRHGPGRLGS